MLIESIAHRRRKKKPGLLIVTTLIWLHILWFNILATFSILVIAIILTKIIVMRIVNKELRTNTTNKLWNKIFRKNKIAEIIIILMVNALIIFSFYTLYEEVRPHENDEVIQYNYQDDSIKEATSQIKDFYKYAEIRQVYEKQKKVFGICFKNQLYEELGVNKIIAQLNAKGYRYKKPDICEDNKTSPVSFTREGLIKAFLIEYSSVAKPLLDKLDVVEKTLEVAKNNRLGDVKAEIYMEYINPVTNVKTDDYFKKFDERAKEFKQYNSLMEIKEYFDKNHTDYKIKVFFFTNKLSYDEDEKYDASYKYAHEYTDKIKAEMIEKNVYQTNNPEENIVVLAYNERYKSSKW